MSKFKEIYWLKDKRIGRFVINWGRDTQDPYYFDYSWGCIEFTIKSYRFILEW